MKACKICKVEKPLNEFYKRGPEGLYRNECKECIKQLRKAYRTTEDYKISYRAYTSTTTYKEKARAKEQKLIKSGWRRKYENTRYNEDIQYKLRKCLRARLNSFMRSKNSDKQCSAIRDLGMPLQEFKVYLETKWTEGMSWSNYGNKPGQWTIDHIKPLNSFDLANAESFKQAQHYTNLQPMWATDNYKKSDRIDF
jgi:hypothetical protein